MLEIRDLCKTYKPKKGVPVQALDHINLVFPNKGMVFLLGKSGSGKSTLLNLLGGLDKYDEGEILIKNVSSKSFTQGHFDSYRNTYLGFIFQEYNILEEFNVGANIALALELQGKKATDEEINRILEQVDLAGYGNRKPNELSGGQKQRVAIARALVKNPEIIMADEPTGALDSNTGRQVLDTLKKLSEEKLVIIVSHDREFAEKYADRIIELADGRVISDVEYFAQEEETVEKGLTFMENEVKIAPQYHLSQEDLQAINEWLEGKNGAALSKYGHGGSGRVAKPTLQENVKQSFDKAFELIKSKLPMKNAFRIGVSSLKYKKIRLVITILLSCISFGLFGLADTFGCYNHLRTCTQSIIDSNISHATFGKELKYVEDDYTYYSQIKLKDEDVEKISQELGMEFSKVVRNDSFSGMFDTQYDTEKQFTETDYHIYTPNFRGYAAINEKLLKEMGATILKGTLPDSSKNEIAITKYLAQTFLIGGYREYAQSYDNNKFETISKAEDMVGKTIYFDGTNYTISAVIDTNFDLDRYLPLTKEQKGDSNLNQIVDYALYAELESLRSSSLLCYALTDEKLVDKKSEDIGNVYYAENGYMDFYYKPNQNNETYFWVETDGFVQLEEVADQIVWLTDKKTQLSDDEVILPETSILELMEIVGLEGTIEENKDKLPAVTREFYLWGDFSEQNSPENVKIVGYLPKRKNVIISNEYLVKLNPHYQEFKDGKYDIIIGAMPQGYDSVKDLVEYSLTEKQNVRYDMRNSVMFELDGMDELFKQVSKIFLYIGIGFALFASLMLANFISTSISYKKQEIGILRAIGARGSDVFRIFFSESFVIAMINFVLATAGTALATAIINGVVRSTGILVTILHFGVRQIVLLFVVSVLVAAIASFLPVWHIAKKRPIDAIRNR